MAMNKRKATTAIVAGVTAVALLLGGTFAWTSISQQAKNEAIVDINPGGRLHDDFNGTNKDVYVENFGDTTTGVPIFARIRLDQYFEVGQDAGINKDGTARKVNQILGTDINNVETWVTYIPTLDENGNIDFSALQANGNWSWKLGKTEDEGLPYYMPTFNKDKDSLAADINGTYEGTTEGDIVHYDDYVQYGTADEAAANDQIVATKTDTEVYDWDDDDATEETDPTITKDETTPRDDADVYHKEGQEHTATQLSSGATVMTMQQWIEAGSQPGAFWVYDTDGWAYWAQAIEPTMTTGLLLDSISMTKVPDDNYYYGINVVAQFATAGDIGEFNAGDPDSDQTWTTEAEELFVTITGAEEIVISGADTIAIGETATYTATRMTLGNTATNQPDFVWSVDEIEGVTMNNGELTVAETVALGTKITVTATASDVATLAEDDETATQALAGSKTVTVLGNVKLTANNGLTQYEFGQETTETFTAEIVGADIADGTLTWKVTDGDGNDLTKTTITDGTLSIPADEMATVIVVTATYKSNDGELEFSGSYEISLKQIVATDNMEHSAYALLTPNGYFYKMSFIRAEEEPTAGEIYGGVQVTEVFVVDEVATYAPTDWPWGISEHKSHINEIRVDSPIQPQCMNRWFDGMANLITADLTNLDTSKVTGMISLFNECTNLSSVTGIDDWDVGSVTEMTSMFLHCSSLTTLDLSDWDVSDVTDMMRMFQECTKLTVDCSNWDVGKVSRHDYFNTNAPGVILPTAWQ